MEAELRLKNVGFTKEKLMFGAKMIEKCWFYLVKLAVWSKNVEKPKENSTFSIRISIRPIGHVRGQGLLTLQALDLRDLSCSPQLGS